ncbi:hypothetical protein [Defluviimonas sp. SAOS-178_SWC]|uniref:hypothetical protein n=1 Tax=Defluviimonas sp. SAOS-178_SWC TaxID=3121287 RepID=UPI00322166AB
MRMIAPQTIAFTAQVTEDEIRERMAMEVLEQIGALGENGKPLPGIKWSVHRGTGRGGGYTINVTGPAPVRISLPKPSEG